MNSGCLGVFIDVSFTFPLRFPGFDRVGAVGDCNLAHREPVGDAPAIGLARIEHGRRKVGLIGGVGKLAGFEAQPGAAVVDLAVLAHIARGCAGEIVAAEKYQARFGAEHLDVK